MPLAAPADLVVPDHLLPADGRFGCGPSKIRPDALAALAATGSSLLGTSHRQPTVRDLVRRLQDGLRDLFRLPDDYQVLLTNGGATAFWDAATFGLVQSRSQHEVFGEFSSKFATAAAAAPWLEEPVLVTAEPGTRPTHQAPADGVDLYALTHNETSTGVMATIERPVGDALVVVDATSGAGGLDVDPLAFDAYYFSLQKGFAAEGGLVACLTSPAALERIAAIAATDRFVPAFLDLPTVVDNSSKNQTYNTPALATVFLAVHQVEWMLAQGGLDAMVSSGRKKSDVLYEWAQARPWASPFVQDPDARSLVVGTIDLDGVDADEVNVALRANGVLDTDAYRKLGRNQLRVGMFPAVDLEDIEAYTATVDWIVEQLT